MVLARVLVVALEHLDDATGTAPTVLVQCTDELDAEQALRVAAGLMNAAAVIGGRS